ncbi:MAG: hypothetical protein LBP36_01665 [Oscillospiraceae bacterium]|nr:hypothetical protein [Oscillospiraceae bacterium]
MKLKFVNITLAALAVVFMASAMPSKAAHGDLREIRVRSDNSRPTSLVFLGDLNSGKKAVIDSLRSLDQPGLKFDVRECPGDQQYVGLVSQYLRGANIAVIVVNPNNSDENVEKWYNLVKENAANAEVFLVVNLSFVVDRKPDIARFQRLESELSLPSEHLIYLSPVTGEGVEYLKDGLFETAVRLRESHSTGSSSRISESHLTRSSSKISESSLFSSGDGMDEVSEVSEIEPSSLMSKIRQWWINLTNLWSGRNLH